VVASDRLWNPARRWLSLTGVRSPSSHGVKMTRRAPGGEPAARAVRSSYEHGSRPSAPVPAVGPPSAGPAAPNNPSSAATTLSRSHWRHSPEVSWLLASRYPPSNPGMLAMPWTTSVFLRGTGRLIHDVVLSAMWASPRPIAPEPMAAACRSGTPATTRTPGGRPRSAATSSRTGPMTDPVATSGGSLSPSTPDRRTRSSS